jgi:hypothetical protein
MLALVGLSALSTTALLATLSGLGVLLSRLLLASTVSAALATALLATLIVLLLVHAASPWFLPLAQDNASRRVRFLNIRERPIL